MRENPLFVSTLEKGLRVLHAFYNGHGPIGLPEICRATGLDKSAVQRFTHTLTVLGYLAKDERTKRYYPAPRLLDFSYMYLHADPILQAAAPHLLSAREEAGEAVNLGKRDGTDVIYVFRIPSPSARILSPITGARAPVYCTATGRAILSRMPEAEAAAVIDASDRRALTSLTITDRAAILERVAATRVDGFTIAVQECLPGEITVAAPVLNKDDQVIAAVNISASTKRWNETSVREHLAPIIVRTALAISRTQGHPVASAMASVF